ncbi:MAG: 1,4-alpha-glucan branching protein GlgB [Thiotrichales bacterium]|jgi:1,4-alpha-glucan branching enzyme|nr:1,4-alpha-glucan branching protein GlgB [Thiotrichales bacterium]MBT4260923.1 1,4-alpha-glucan branching protein GlgB [Thiotrichales bacterium]MBT5291773.1 1,4-alpha-glucan branching protein GlgB [Thiotrichales bacterium]MBT6617062.1 1,4-alpha-glucan branching protein GlgB [Thiotrichales bacterium]MBT7869552.1 1,4-alpha-glucan branching protein GlgB [Thiotrichales bacterium]
MSRHLLGEVDLHLIAEGQHQRLYDKLGAHPTTLNEIYGTLFSVWAPNARRVSVVGNFNQWNGDSHPMNLNYESGIWELFIPTIEAGTIYKYEIVSSDGYLLPLKSDPFAFFAEEPPRTASIVYNLENYIWNDSEWMERRAESHHRRAPISIYELHLGSWKKKQDKYLNYIELADELIPYVQRLGFTHIELLPINEHPFDGSWGYQPTALFAPTSRFGTPDQFREFVDRCHQAGVGVILDWVAGHFPEDQHGLIQFDGSHLYEHQDPRQGRHEEWGTLIYNFGRTEVSNFLTANALFWLEQYHIDGLRVDAVASMLYLDYNREGGDWVPNRYGSNENLDAVNFLKQLNEKIYHNFPDCVTIAEESTAWPMVSQPTSMGGLGFGFKWNMGWMNDTLEYIQRDSIHRAHHQNEITFGLLYAFHENFILPLSHDEVVHGKRSLLNKMPGDLWQQFANLRLYLTFLYTHPGKKLLFMGGEFGQWSEWNHKQSLDWHLTEEGDPNQHYHCGLQKLVTDINHLYRNKKALHELDNEGGGFEWIDCSDHENGIISFIRKQVDGAPLITICNFTPVVRSEYRIGVPNSAHYRELLNSDSSIYGGGNQGNSGGVESEPTASHGMDNSINLTIPPLGVIVLEPTLQC